MEKYYKKLSLLLSENKNISKDDEELYEYAIKVLSQGVIGFFVSIFIGFSFGMMRECAWFIFPFLLIRKFTGGLHCKKYFYCFLNSIFLIINSLLLIRFLEKSNYQMIFLFSVVISFIIIAFLSPIENDNKSISKKEKNLFKVVSIILSIIDLNIVFCFIENKLFISYSCGLSLILISLLMIAAKLKVSLIQ